MWCIHIVESTQPLVDKLAYLWSSVTSAENDFSMWLAKAGTAIDNLSMKWKSNLSDKIERNFFIQRMLLSRYSGYITEWPTINEWNKIELEFQFIFYYEFTQPLRYD